MIDYLDCNATTPVDPRVQAVVRHFLEHEFGNAGSLHEYGARAKAAVQTARDAIGAVVAARRHEVFFTSGATESNNLALLGLARHGADEHRQHIVSTRIEHNSVLEPLAELSRRGFQVTLVPPDRGGRVSAQEIMAAVRHDTLMVSVMHANNETGVLQPIAEIASGLTDRDLFFHVDASQTFGKEIADLRSSRIDLISISGHKIYRPKGIGALVARRRESRLPPLRPLQFGGGQELGLRPGTLPVPLVAGLGKAADLALAEHVSRGERCADLRARILAALQCLTPVLHGDQRCVQPHVLNVSFPGVVSDDAIEALAEVAAVSNGAACTSVCATASHVLTAMGVPAVEADGALRLSWCHNTTLAHLDSMVAILRRMQTDATPSRSA